MDFMDGMILGEDRSLSSKSMNMEAIWSKKETLELANVSKKKNVYQVMGQMQLI